MPADPAALKRGRLVSQAIHATAVAIGDRALLIRGASRAGKSRLALALIARSTAALPVELIGDDRILLHRAPDGYVARPHPRIAGFIERRGLGLVAMPWRAEATVGAVANLCCSSSSLATAWDHGAEGDREIPQLSLDAAEDAHRADRVLTWWAGLSAA